MSLVYRKYRCGFDHEWQALVEKGSPPPAECPTCQAIVAASDPTHAPARARSDNMAAPGLRGERTKAIARFEEHAFKRPHYDNGAPLLTNLRDNVKPGETYAVPETPSSNETMRMTKEMIQAKEQAAKPGRNTEGAHLTAMGGGWQGATPDLLSKTAGSSPNLGRAVVDIKSNKRA